MSKKRAQRKNDPKGKGSQRSQNPARSSVELCVDCHSAGTCPLWPLSSTTPSLMINQFQSKL